MASDAMPAPAVQLADAIRAATGDLDLQVDNLVIFYQDDAGGYGTLSNCCCGTHRVALMAAGMYQIENLPPSGTLRGITT